MSKDQCCGTLKAPPGWSCAREVGHEGPCAAWPTEPLASDENEALLVEIERLEHALRVAETIRDAARVESQKHLDENRALRVKLGEASQAGVISSVNEAIQRAGIHCAVTFAEAIDMIAAERDDARKQNVALRAVRDRMQAEFDELRPFVSAAREFVRGELSFDALKYGHDLLEERLRARHPEYDAFCRAKETK